MKNFIISLAQHGLTLGGGALVVSGHDLSTTIGVIISLAGYAWSVIEKHYGSNK